MTVKLIKEMSVASAEEVASVIKNDWSEEKQKQFMKAIRDKVSA